MKNKNLKIFTFLILILFGFCFTKQVKAYTVQSLSPVDGTLICHGAYGGDACLDGIEFDYNIPSHSNDSILFCFKFKDDSYGVGSGSYLTVNNATSTLIVDWGGALYYYVDPPTGPTTIKTDSWSPDPNRYRCSIISGINTDNPIKATDNQGDVWGLTSRYYPYPTVGNLLIGFFGTDGNGNSYYPYTLNDTFSETLFSGQHSSNRSTYSEIAGYFTPTSTDSILLSISPNPNYTSHIFFVEFNGNIEYCGDSLCQTATENCSTCPVDCGECAENPNVSDYASLFFFSNPYTFSNQSTAIVRYLYNESVLTPYDYIEIRKINSDWTSTFIATSTIIETSGISSGKMNGSSFFTLSEDPGATGFRQYEVIGHLASYWSMSLGYILVPSLI